MHHEQLHAIHELWFRVSNYRFATHTLHLSVDMTAAGFVHVLTSASSDYLLAIV